jgi:lactose/cellobiose-specific phosphotransferase system IIC component
MGEKGKTVRHKMQKLYQYLDGLKILRCIRGSLVLMIPVLLIGSLALVFCSLPIAGYQTIIHEFLSGALYNFFHGIYQATFGLLAVYMTMSVAVCYTQQNMSVRSHNYGTLFTSLICFFIFSGVFAEGEFQVAAFGAQGMFTAIVCALSASFLYDFISRKISMAVRLYAEGTDDTFHDMIFTIIPLGIVSGIFAVLNMLLAYVFHVSSFQMLFTNLINHIFENMGRSLGTAVLFEALLNLLWFFGIHGNDVLESACQNIFVPAIDVNNELIRQGLPATEIYSKTFFDVFVIMGGCGGVLCLLLVILFFGKRRSNRNLARFAALPMLFNISEMMVFGLPIVFNPVFLIPFLCVPVVLTLVSSFAIQMGFVPVPIHTVEWTTPILLGGYLATDSIAGSILQLINVGIGMLIYYPFVRLFEEESLRNAEFRMERLVRILQESEETRNPVSLLTFRNDIGAVARGLADDLVFQMRTGLPVMYYQPQFDADGECIGAEALLRWKHSLYGMVYPPLIVKLAEESDKLLALEKSVFQAVFHDMERLYSVFGENAKISVNATGGTIQSDDFEQFLQQLKEEYPAYCRNVVIEITEQAALQINEKLIERLTRIQNLGFGLAIDDFSMGNTSIKYLQTNLFSLIKLDGALSKGVMNNSRSRNIIASIAKLSSDFGIRVLAEYVETKEQQKILADAGCCWYQGYLYSPAVPLEELEKRFSKEKKSTEKNEQTE